MKRRAGEGGPWPAGRSVFTLQIVQVRLVACLLCALIKHIMQSGFDQGKPYAGGVEEAFTCPEQGVLHVTSTVTVGGQSETTLQVLPSPAASTRMGVCAKAAAAFGAQCALSLFVLLCGLQVYRNEGSWKPKNKFTLGTFGLTAPPKNIWEGH